MNPFPLACKNLLQQAWNRRQQLCPPVPPPATLNEALCRVWLCSFGPIVRKTEHNLLHCRQWPLLKCTESSVKFGLVVFETRQQTDRHGDTPIALFCTRTAGRVIITEIYGSPAQSGTAAIKRLD